MKFKFYSAPYLASDGKWSSNSSEAEFDSMDDALDAMKSGAVIQEDLGMGFIPMVCQQLPTTHELKLSITYFESVESGEKNFEIRNNDRGFQVGDILELKAFELGRYAFRNHEGRWVTNNIDVDTIRAKVVSIITSEQYNKECEFTAPEIFEEKLAYKYGIAGTQAVLNNFFNTDHMPEGYVLLKIEVLE